MMNAKRKLTPALIALAKPHPVDCRVCGKRVLVKGANAHPLCDKHREEIRAKRKAERRKERESEQARNVRNVRSAGAAAIPADQNPVVRASPSVARLDQSYRANGPLPESSKASGRIVGASFRDAVTLITAPEQRREGWRHGWIGNTGTGKTTAALAFMQQSAVLTLVHDDTKLDPQYERSAVVERFDDAPELATTITLRGDAFKGTTVEVETVAALTLQIARASREPVRLVIDELDRAVTRGGRELESPSLRSAFTLGRALGVSVMWLTQTPQRAPIEVVDQSTTIGIFQLGPRAMNYLDERLCFDADLLRVVPDLAVGQFVIYEQGRPWNRTIYQTPAP